MHILLTGATGFIGSALVPSLLERGHRLSILTRREISGEGKLRYLRSLDEVPAGEVDAVINLAGAPLAQQRWSEAYKREIRDSRLDITRHLLAWMRSASRPPRALLNASAIGFYGIRGDDKICKEGAGPGLGFASELCADWEALACEAAKSMAVRTQCLRFGVVLDAGGGAFEELVRPFRWGLGTWMGSGRQWMSWVHRADVVAAIHFLLEDSAPAGAFNITAPEPVTARDFCRISAGYYPVALQVPVPALVARLLVGGMADELLLGGQRVVPFRLQKHGFQFLYADLDSALGAIRASERKL